MRDGKDEYLDDPITEREIRQVCCKLKLTKAGGFDHTVYEHFKYGNVAVYSHLCIQYNTVIKYQYIPKDWKRGLIIQREWDTQG